MEKELIIRNFDILSQHDNIVEITLKDLIKIVKENKADFDNVVIRVNTMGYESPWIEIIHNRQETKKEQADRIAMDICTEILATEKEIYNLEKQLENLKKTPIIIEMFDEHKRRISQKKIQLDCTKEILSKLIDKRQNILQTLKED